MVRLMSILSVGVVLGCLALATAADAQNASAALPPPPLTCTVSANTVRVDAVPDGAGNFPVAAKCPADAPGTLNCFKWSYRYTLLGGGNNISLSAVTVDSDVAIVAATSGSPESGGGMKTYNAGESDSAIGLIGNNAFDFRTVRFASQGAVVLGHVYTGRDVGIGSVTAVSKVGNQGATTCQIAGADNIDSDSVGFSPVITSTQIDQFNECRIELVLDAKGCTSDVHVTSSNPNVTCTVTEETTINGKAILGGPCNKPSGLVVDGSTCIWYCPTSYGTCFKVCK
jgi:hypothetical protein